MRIIRLPHLPRRVRHGLAFAGAGALLVAPALAFAVPPSQAAAAKPTATVTVTQTVTQTVTAPPQTVTVTAPPTTVTVTQTVAPSTTTAPTTTTPATSVTTTASPTTTATAAACVQPTPTNVGASGNLPASSVTTLTSGQTLENVTVSGLDVHGDNITIRNVRTGGVNVDTASHVTVDHVTSDSNAIVDASDVSFTNSILGGDTQYDAMFISPWNTTVKNVTMKGNYIKRPNLPVGTDAHFDATQVRGVDNLLIQCNNYDLGAYQDGYNASIYLETAWPLSNITVDNNWVDGGAFDFMIGKMAVPSSLKVTNNKAFSGHVLYGICYLLGTKTGFNQSDLDAMTQTGNTVDGQPAQVCKSSDIS